MKWKKPSLFVLMSFGCEMNTDYTVFENEFTKKQKKAEESILCSFCMYFL